MDKDTLIQELIKEKGGTKEQYLSLMNKIAYHESGHTLDPTIKQKGGGPGRGKYQFEEGKNAGGITAAKRTKTYLKQKGKDIPKWLNDAASGESLDATKLTADQQDILFLGNMRQHPKADFAKYVNGDETAEDFWANYHWAGADEDRPKRLRSFNESMTSYTDVAPNVDKIQNQLVQSKNEQYTATQDNIQSPQQHKVQPELANNQMAMTQQQEQPQNLMAYLQQNKQKAPQEQGLNSFNGGGTHQQNPNGGIPQGIGANGQPNTVEEGETSYDFGDDKFIFSNRINLTDYINNKKKQS